ncbi:MAG: phosphodiester glycosidase family protein [Solobacterium sp.]|nr:phosphodiester glycosidase family protein [Solobacterium sp.]
MGKRIGTLLLTLLLGGMSLLTGVSAESESRTVTIQILWNDNENPWFTRPDEVHVTISDNDADGDGSETLYSAMTIAALDNWQKTIEFRDTWVNPTVQIESVNGYRSSRTVNEDRYIISYTSSYLNATDEISVDVVWDDETAVNRPETFDLQLIGMDGTEVTVKIPSTEVHTSVSGIPFLVNGERNPVHSVIAAVDGYEVESGTSISNTGRSVYLRLHHSSASASSLLSDGYSTCTWEGQTISIYKQSGNEKLALLTSPMDANGKFTTLDITAFQRPGIQIKAIVNASYFNMNNVSPLSSYPTTVYGRIQGMMSDGRIINATTPGPGDGVSGDKPYMDLVITPDGSIEAGDMNSWDYHWGDAIGYPNEVMAGVSPAGVELLNGKDVNLYSPAVGYAKITTPNTQTALVKCDDGSFALVAVSGKLAPLESLRNFAKAYGMTELSIYDSGGSTQMGYFNGSGMVYPIYTGRRIPAVWILYEEENDSNEGDPVDVTVKFVDEDTDPQDLSAYSILVSTTVGNELPINTAEVIASLKEAGYKIEDVSLIPDRVDGRIQTYTIPVTHQYLEQTFAEQAEAMRTVKFVDEAGTELAPDEVQRIAYTRIITETTDLVTGKKTREVELNVPESSVFAAITSLPEITGFGSEISELPAEEMQEGNLIRYVKYKAIAAPITVRAAFDGKIIYTNSFDHSVDLLVYDMDKETPIRILRAEEDAELVLTPLTHEGYVFDHYEIESTDTAVSFIPFYRSIKTLTLICDGKEGGVTYKKNFEESFTVVLRNGDGSENTILFEKSDTYTPEAEVIEGKRLKEWQIEETGNGVILTPIYEEEATSRTALIHFIDENETKHDLSAYTAVVQTTEELERIVAELESAGYRLSEAQLPEVTPGKEFTITVNHRITQVAHEAEETVYSRTIHYVYEDGTMAAEDLIQSITKQIPSYVAQVDMVTGVVLTNAPEAIWIPGPEFPEAPHPELAGYSAEISESLEDEITVTYVKLPEVLTATIEFNDVNSDPQDLSEYTLTYQGARGESVSIDCSETVTRLSEMNYLLKTTVPDTISYGETITIEVDHKTESEDVPEKSTEYRRTIHYVDEQGESLFEDTVQTLTGTIPAYQTVTDLVTGKDLTVIPETVWANGNTFVVVVVPTKDGYEAERLVIPEAEPATETVTVTYKAITSEESGTFEVLFEDQNASAQTLESISVTAVMGTRLGRNEMMIEKVNELEASGFMILTDLENIIVDGGPITISLDHQLDVTTSTETIKRSRIIHRLFDGEDEPVNQSCDVVLTIETTTDLVTKEEVSTRTSAMEGLLPAYDTTTEHWIADVETVEEVDFSVSGFYEPEVTITYTKEKNEVTVRFLDGSDKPLDLSDYTVTKSIPYGEQEDIEWDELIQTLSDLGLRISSELPEKLDSLVPEVVIFVEHQMETDVQQNELKYVRTIEVDGETVIQEAYALEEITIVKDLATKDEVSRTVIRKEVEGKPRRLNLYRPVVKDGYVVSMKEVPEVDVVLEENAPLEETIVITYSRTMVNANSSPSVTSSPSAPVTSPSSVVTCQDAGFPQDWFWDESKKACVGPTINTETTVTVAPSSAVNTWNISSDEAQSAELEAIEEVTPEPSPASQSEEKTPLNPSMDEHEEPKMELINKQEIIWMLGIPIAMILAGLAIWFVKNPALIPWILGLDGVAGVIFAVLDHSIIAWILLVLNLSAAGLLALYRKGKPDSKE